MKNFTKFLKTLNCNHCINLKNNKCSTPNKVQNEIDKEALRLSYLDYYTENIKDTTISKARKEMLLDHKLRSENINDTFICEEYENE